MSRRAAEDAISKGRVSVNGQLAHLGDKADAEKDAILLDGAPVMKSSDFLYIALYKPVGYITTLKDEKGRKDVSSLVSSLGTRLYPVGRLDLNSEGLLIMTNDGEFANRLMHPSFEIKKTYRVEGEFSPSGTPDSEAALSLLGEPIEIDGKMTSPASLGNIRQNGKGISFDITISDGRNREVRRLCRRSGIRVLRLIRIKEGPVKLGSLKPRGFRSLTDAEINELKAYFIND